MKKMIVAAAAMACAASLSAADVYVSLSTGKNKNAGTKEAPLKTSGRRWKMRRTGTRSTSRKAFIPAR